MTSVWVYAHLLSHPPKPSTYVKEQTGDPIDPLFSPWTFLCVIRIEKSSVPRFCIQICHCCQFKNVAVQPCRHTVLLTVVSISLEPLVCLRSTIRFFPTQKAAFTRESTRWQTSTLKRWVLIFLRIRRAVWCTLCIRKMSPIRNESEGWHALCMAKSKSPRAGGTRMPISSSDF